MRRKAVVLAMVGWYLMNPPYTREYPQEGHLGDYHQPLSQWEPFSAYDTAKECEDAKIHLWVMGSRCVGTDDPNLKQPESGAGGWLWNQLRKQY